MVGLRGLLFTTFFIHIIIILQFLLTFIFMTLPHALQFSLGYSIAVPKIHGTKLVSAREAKKFQLIAGG